MRKINFAPGTPEHRRRALRKALKAAHSPAGKAARNAGIRAAAKRRKEAKLNGVPKGQELVPLDAIPGEQRPVIRYTDTPGSSSRKNGHGTISRDMDEREKRQLAMALVATVHALTK